MQEKGKRTMAPIGRHPQTQPGKVLEEIVSEIPKLSQKGRLQLLGI